MPGKNANLAFIAVDLTEVCKLGRPKSHRLKRHNPDEKSDNDKDDNNPEGKPYLLTGTHFYTKVLERHGVVCSTMRTVHIGETHVARSADVAMSAVSHLRTVFPG